MKNIFAFTLLVAMLLSTAAMAQESSMEQLDSAQAAQAFEDFMSTPSAPEKSVASDVEESSSSTTTVNESAISGGETGLSSSSQSEGLVLFNAQSSSSERRYYNSENPIYRFMVTAGLRSPSRGMLSFEYIVSQEVFNIGVHFTDYDEDYFQFGASAIYYPMEVRYFYMFLSSDWFHGEYENDRKVKDRYEYYTETANYWRVVVGLGAEALFMEHFGAYIEAGFEFFAGNGGYYLHCGKANGNLNNDTFKLPYGFGLIFPF